MRLYYSSTIAPLSAKGYTAPPRHNGTPCVLPFKTSLIENWLLWLLPHTLYIAYMNIANPFQLSLLALAAKTHPLSFVFVRCAILYLFAAQAVNHSGELSADHV